MSLRLSRPLTSPPLMSPPPMSRPMSPWLSRGRA